MNWLHKEWLLDLEMAIDLTNALKYNVPFALEMCIANNHFVRQCIGILRLFLGASSKSTIFCSFTRAKR